MTNLLRCFDIFVILIFVISFREIMIFIPNFVISGFEILLTPDFDPKPTYRTVFQNIIGSLDLC